MDGIRQRRAACDQGCQQQTLRWGYRETVRAERHITAICRAAARRLAGGSVWPAQTRPRRQKALCNEDDSSWIFADMIAVFRHRKHSGEELCSSHRHQNRNKTKLTSESTASRHRNNENLTSESTATRHRNCNKAKSTSESVASRHRNCNKAKSTSESSPSRHRNSANSTSESAPSRHRNRANSTSESASSRHRNCNKANSTSESASSRHRNCNKANSTSESASSRHRKRNNPNQMSESTVSRHRNRNRAHSTSELTASRHRNNPNPTSESSPSRHRKRNNPNRMSESTASSHRNWNGANSTLESAASRHNHLYDNTMTESVSLHLSNDSSISESATFWPRNDDTSTSEPAAFWPSNDDTSKSEPTAFWPRNDDTSTSEPETFWPSNNDKSAVIWQRNDDTSTSGSVAFRPYESNANMALAPVNQRQNTNSKSTPANQRENISTSTPVPASQPRMVGIIRTLTPTNQRQQISTTQTKTSGSKDQDVSATKISASTKTGQDASTSQASEPEKKTVPSRLAQLQEKPKPEVKRPEAKTDTLPYPTITHYQMPLPSQFAYPLQLPISGQPVLMDGPANSSLCRHCGRGGPSDGLGRKPRRRKRQQPDIDTFLADVERKLNGKLELQELFMRELEEHYSDVLATRSPPGSGRRSVEQRRVQIREPQKCKLQHHHHQQEHQNRHRQEHQQQEHQLHRQQQEHYRPHQQHHQHRRMYKQSEDYVTGNVRHGMRCPHLQTDWHHPNRHPRRCSSFAPSEISEEDARALDESENTLNDRDKPVCDRGPEDSEEQLRNEWDILTKSLRSKERKTLRKSLSAIRARKNDAELDRQLELLEHELCDENWEPHRQVEDSASSSHKAVDKKEKRLLDDLLREQDGFSEDELLSESEDF